MSKIKEAFQNGKAFIPFITCGDPDLETTKKIVRAMAANGADLIELGIPFSDPTAEGPVIQEANIRALKNHVTTDDVFEMVKELRQELSLPLVFMTYANVIFSYGASRQAAGVGGAGLPAETAAVGAAGGANAPAQALCGIEGFAAQALCGIEGFAARAAECGINGVILPDVPFEEREEFAPVFRKYGIDLISMIAPTSHERIRTIASLAEGYHHGSRRHGKTGAGDKPGDPLRHRLRDRDAGAGGEDGKGCGRGDRRQRHREADRGLGHRGVGGDRRIHERNEGSREPLRVSVKRVSGTGDRDPGKEQVPPKGASL